MTFRAPIKTSGAPASAGVGAAALTIVSVTAGERLRRHVESLTESEAEEALRLLVRRRERRMAARHAGPHVGEAGRSSTRSRGPARARPAARR